MVTTRARTTRCPGRSSRARRQARSRSGSWGWWPRPARAHDWLRRGDRAAIGLRDVGNALTFALAPTRAAATQRMLYDLGDAAVFGPRKPGVAAGALSFAVLAGWTAWRGQVIDLSTGAKMRLTGPTDRAAVVCAGERHNFPGGRNLERPLEWLVSRLARRFPTLAFSECVIASSRGAARLVRGGCTGRRRGDGRGAHAPARLLDGRGRGGAERRRLGVRRAGAGSVAARPHPAQPLRGKRLDVAHGTLDGWFPGVPRRAPVELARRLRAGAPAGRRGSYRLVRGALHGLALRTPLGVVPLPRAGRWADLASERIETWAATYRARRRREHPRRHSPTPHEPHQPGRDADRGRRPAARDACAACSGESPFTGSTSPSSSGSTSSARSGRRSASTATSPTRASRRERL